MNCSQMKMLLAAFASDELSLEERRMVEQHLTSCARCRSELAAMESLQNQLALLQAIPIDTEIADSVISRIRWRTADTHAPEAPMEPMDMLSSYAGDDVDNAKGRDFKTAPIDLPIGSEGRLLPDGGLQTQP